MGKCSKFNVCKERQVLLQALGLGLRHPLCGLGGELERQANPQTGLAAFLRLRPAFGSSFRSVKTVFQRALIAFRRARRSAAMQLTMPPATKGGFFARQIDVSALGAAARGLKQAICGR